MAPLGMLLSRFVSEVSEIWGSDLERNRMS